MAEHIAQAKENKNQSIAHQMSQEQGMGKFAFSLTDNRPEATAQQERQKAANNSPQVKQLIAFQKMANNSPSIEPTASFQKKSSPGMASFAPPAQKKQNNTGLPDNLKTGIENLSGYSMDDVKVHYNSDKPAQLQAHAYAQGTDIHMATGQEKHLAHEAWHVVQQKQGRVRPTTQLKGKMNVNDDDTLEKEADIMGAKAVQMKSNQQSTSSFSKAASPTTTVVQYRFPNMTEAQINDNPVVAREVLLHGIRIYNSNNENQLPIEILKNQEATPEVLNHLYKIFSEKTLENEKYVNENAEATKPESEMIESIQRQLPSIVDEITNTINAPEVIKGIFGVEEENLGPIVDIFLNVQRILQQHIDSKTCPILIAGNQHHNNWLGVEGMTEMGKSCVELSLSAAQLLTKGNPIGKATLVHEFTHATSNTKDHAYNLSAMTKLGPKKRMDNASSYEHCFLEVNGNKNPKRYYNPDAIKRKKEKNTKADVEVKKAKAKASMNYLVGLWNTLDNCYLLAQKGIASASTENRNLHNQEKLVANLGCFPHLLFEDPSTYEIGLALIEDRTELLGSYMHKPMSYKDYFNTMDIDELEQMEPSDILSGIVANQIKMSDAHATYWIYYLKHPSEYEQAQGNT